MPGSFCWPELATPDSPKAKAFYAGLFGWTSVDVPSAGGTYTLLQLRGKDVAACRTLSEDENSKGIPSYFMTYISTASADASAAKAADLGRGRTSRSWRRRRGSSRRTPDVPERDGTPPSRSGASSRRCYRPLRRRSGCARST